MRLRRILHATDFSPASRRAFATALTLARRNRAELLLVHVAATPAPLLEDAYLSAESYRKALAGGRRAAQKRLDAWCRRARQHGVRAAAVVLDGIAFQEIPRLAQRRRADLVVIGTHGRTGFRRLLMGSVARRVIGLTRCPVLTVPSSVRSR
jgi:nucleotide-binding universal stress UspA family protein